MNPGTQGKVTVKVTVADDENPELFIALRNVKDPRRRSARIRDLAVKGLMVERGSVAVGAPATIGGGVTSDKKAFLPLSGADSVDDILDWGRET